MNQVPGLTSGAIGKKTWADLERLGMTDPVMLAWLHVGRAAGWSQQEVLCTLVDALLAERRAMIELQIQARGAETYNGLAWEKG